MKADLQLFTDAWRSSHSALNQPNLNQRTRRGGPQCGHWKQTIWQINDFTSLCFNLTTIASGQLIPFVRRGRMIDVQFNCRKSKDQNTINWNSNRIVWWWWVVSRCHSFRLKMRKLTIVGEFDYFIYISRESAVHWMAKVKNKIQKKTKSISNELW